MSLMIRLTKSTRQGKDAIKTVNHTTCARNIKLLIKLLMISLADPI